MGKMICDTGGRVVRVGLAEKVALALLAVLGIEAVLYYADYWFLGGHRKNIFLFVILSYAVFRGVFRNVLGWIFFQFVSITQPPLHVRRYSVDVLTTAMPGEPYDMFETTLSAIKKLSYPHASYLLDGGNDARLKELCARLGVVHVNCLGVPGAKAGKINHCLARYARGEIVVVLDPDHVPQPDFIDRTLPYFGDEKVGFVQVVQAYSNYSGNIVAHGAAEQTFGFYGPLMMALNGLDMAIAIGANCTFRRAALDSIGGHAEHLAEDACTSMRIHAAGWKSRYVPYRASYGLVPEDLAAFFKQQLKWATGMFFLLFKEYPRLFGRFNVQQKVYYLFAGTFFLNGAVTFCTILFPVLFLFFQIYAIEMPISGFFLHCFPYIIVSLAITMYLQRWYSSDDEKGFPWRSMFLEKGTWHIYSLAFLYALMGRKVPWLPTPKKAASPTGMGLLLPHVFAVALSLAAVAFPFFFYHRIDHGTQLMMAFAGMNVATLTPVIAWGLFSRRGAGQKQGA
jgi:cellulose synthase (UDP-forming)